MIVPVIILTSYAIIIVMIIAIIIKRINKNKLKEDKRETSDMESSDTESKALCPHYNKERHICWYLCEESIAKTGRPIWHMGWDKNWYKYCTTDNWKQCPIITREKRDMIWIKNR